MGIVGLNDKHQRERERWSSMDGAMGMKNETIPRHVADDQADEMWQMELVNFLQI